MLCYGAVALAWCRLLYFPTATVRWRAEQNAKKGQAGLGSLPVRCPCWLLYCTNLLWSCSDLSVGANIRIDMPLTLSSSNATTPSPRSNEARSMYVAGVIVMRENTALESFFSLPSPSHAGSTVLACDGPQPERETGRPVAWHGSGSGDRWRPVRATKPKSYLGLLDPLVTFFPWRPNAVGTSAMICRGRAAGVKGALHCVRPLVQPARSSSDEKWNGLERWVAAARATHDGRWDTPSVRARISDACMHDGRWLLRRNPARDRLRSPTGRAAWWWSAIIVQPRAR
jgi:hypothetical protein